MFLTVNEVNKNPDGIMAVRTNSLIVENIVKYREFRKGPLHADIEGKLTKVDMVREDGFEYFHVIAEDPFHFENRVNKVKWLLQNSNVRYADPSGTTSSIPEPSAQPSESSAPSEESQSETS